MQIYAFFSFLQSLFIFFYKKISTVVDILLFRPHRAASSACRSAPLFCTHVAPRFSAVLGRGMDSWRMIVNVMLQVSCMIVSPLRLWLFTSLRGATSATCSEHRLPAVFCLLFPRSICRQQSLAGGPLCLRSFVSTPRSFRVVVVQWKRNKWGTNEEQLRIKERGWCVWGPLLPWLWNEWRVADGSAALWMASHVLGEEGVVCSIAPSCQNYKMAIHVPRWSEVWGMGKAFGGVVDYGELRRLALVCNYHGTRYIYAG